MRSNDYASLLRLHGHAAKKSWGQNFLHDPRIISSIVAATGAVGDETVVEIGAGLGALTFALANHGCRVFAIERDRQLVAILEEAFAQNERVTIVEANALSFDYQKFGEPVRIVGNLPYQISSQIIFRLLDQRSGIRSATLMLQRELAERLVATPGTRIYGAPSVTCQHYFSMAKCLRVGRGAFTPQPRVDSTVIQMVTRPSPLSQVDPDAFVSVVRSAFSGRRKMLSTILGRHFGRSVVNAAFAASHVSPQARAETLSVMHFADLAREIKLRQSDTHVQSPAADSKIERDEL